MGEAIYYMKISFESSEEASEALPKIREFIKEGIAAQDYWQANRHGNGAKFWPEFKEKFPDVYEYLDDLRDGDCNNDLAGHLDFGSDHDEDSLMVDGNVIRYSALVWHFAEWERLGGYLQGKFGAAATVWMSDEYVDMWEYLDCVGGSSPMPTPVTSRSVSDLIRGHSR